MSEERSKLRVIIFSLSWMLVVLICTAFVLKLIWNLWFPPFLNQKPAKINPKIVEMQALTQDIQPDNYTVAYKAVSGDLMSERFHDWQIPSPKDAISVCITCHGDMPHNKDEKTRSFINMHDMHIACETCHMEISTAPGRGMFVWYDVQTGDIRHTLPNIEAPLLITHNKLLLLADRDLHNYRNDSFKKDAEMLLARASDMGAGERKRSVEQFHKNKRSTALDCRACHTADGDIKTSFIPYAKLGYSELRARQINNTEVVGMIEKYGSFYLPTFLSGQGVSR